VQLVLSLQASIQLLLGKQQQQTEEAEVAKKKQDLPYHI
jgi:hypothetical protein